VLIDAGCEYRGYAGDITRTFPVNGKFSPAQREIYDIVLESLETALELYRPGTSIQQVNRRSGAHYDYRSGAARDPERRGRRADR
jgi:Xaa-Pro aminopeptidase